MELNQLTEMLHTGSKDIFQYFVDYTRIEATSWIVTEGIFIIMVAIFLISNIKKIDFHAIKSEADAVWPVIYIMIFLLWVISVIHFHANIDENIADSFYPQKKAVEEITFLIRRLIDIPKP